MPSLDRPRRRGTIIPTTLVIAWYSGEASWSSESRRGAAGRAASLIRPAVLLAGLAAILLVSYGQMVPLPRGLSYWRLPIGLATAGGLALLLAWPSHRAGVRARTVDDVAAMLGVASTIVGIGAAILVTVGLSLNFAENRQTTQSFVYQMTNPAVAFSLLAIAVPAAISGALGLAIGRRHVRIAGRVSAAGVAVRFSIIGLGCAAVIGALAAALAIYRWVTWGWG